MGTTTNDEYLVLIQHLFRERSSCLEWQALQAAMDAGLQNTDKLRKVFVENGGHIAQTARGTKEWRFGNPGGGRSTHHNVVPQPPDTDDAGDIVRWMARQRRTR